VPNILADILLMPSNPLFQFCGKTLFITTLGVDFPLNQDNILLFLLFFHYLTFLVVSTPKWTFITYLIINDTTINVIKYANACATAAPFNP